MDTMAAVRSVLINLPDLGAGVDQIEASWRVPASGARIIAAAALFKEATAGVDGANGLDIGVRVVGAANAIRESVLFANQAAGAVVELQVVGAPPTENPALAAGTNVEILVVQGATANIGRAAVQIDYVPLVTELS